MRLPQQTSCAPAEGDGERWVGDPVDVVTGAQTDRALDFRLAGNSLGSPADPRASTFGSLVDLRASTDVLFYRHYASQRAKEDTGLGPGFRHGFDHRLLFDVDGMRYVAPDGSEASFPFLSRAGARETAPGWFLTRTSAQAYALVASDDSQTLHFQMDREGRGSLQSLLQGEQWLRFQYSAERQLVGLDSSIGYAVRFEWSSRGRLSRAIWCNPADGRERALIQYFYDEHGRLTGGIDGYGHKFGLAYDTAQRVTRRTDRNGYSFEFAYDDQGRCVQARGQDGVLEVKLAYEPDARMTKVTHGDGGEWLYFYDETSTLLQVIDPHGGTTVYGKDPETGRVDAKIDPAGSITRYIYDTTGKLSALVTPTGEHYSPGDEPPKPQYLVGTDGLAWELGLDAGRAFTLPDRASVLAPVTPPVRSELVLSKVPGVGSFQPVRDAYGTLAREQRADGAHRRYAYDPNGNLLTYVDADGRVFRYEYGSWNHLMRELDPLGHAVEHRYNASEKRTSLLDAGGTRSDYVYDKKDRLVEVHRHGRLRERYVYDPADRLLEKQGSDGKQLLKWTYGAGPLKATRELSSGEKQSFTYDARGRLQTAAGAAGSLSFAYDMFGRRIQDLRDERGVEHGEDWLDVRVLGRFVTRRRLVDDRRSVLVDPTGQVHRIERDAHGVVVREFAHGIRETVQFHPDGMPLLKAVELAQKDAPLWISRYQYDQEGNLLRHIDTERGARSYGYDAAGRLASEQGPDGKVEPYEYDAAGNLLRMPGLSEGEVVTEGLREPGAGQIARGAGNRVYRANGELFHYNQRDHVGMRAAASGEESRYHYDSFDQLIAVDAPGLSFSAKYDVLGRRTEKTINGACWSYYWDTDRLVAECFPDGRVRIYVYAGEQALVPLLFVDYASEDAALDSGQVYYVFTNQLGCPERITSAAGVAVWSASIAPYGAVTVEMGADFHQPLRFPGHYYDAETGLHYNRFRYYDPTLGRYLQSDPDGIRGGYNLYAYTDNPLRQVDVRGLGCPGAKEDGAEGEDGPEQEGTARKLLPAPRKPMGGTPEELARAPGNSAEQRAAREAIANDFYKKHCPGMEDEDIEGHLNGIDFNHPVEVVTIPPGGAGPEGNQLNQHSFPGGGPGQYFTHEPGTTPSQLGISDRVLVPGNGNTPPRIVPRESRTYEVEPGAPAQGLRSTAAPVEDTWSISGQPTMTQGGGSQTMVPRGGQSGLHQT